MLLLLLSLLGLLSTQSLLEQPNILFIMADDLGYEDVGFQSSDIKTPHLDKLATEGVILQNHYVMPSCSPTRTSFMTGRLPIKTGFWYGNIKPIQEWGLGLNETLIPQMLKHYGYKTHCVGKWHLGMYTYHHTPVYRGFDTFLGMYLGSGDYFQHENRGAYDMRRNWRTGENGKFKDEILHDMKGVYSTDIYTNRTIELLEDHAQSTDSAPFFIYLSYQTPHGPYQAPRGTIKKYTKKMRTKSVARKVYGTMISIMDEGIGRVYQSLEELGLSEKTVLVFSSDNGGVVGGPSSNYPLRGGKTGLFEGGIRGISFVNSNLLKRTGYINTNLHHIIDWYPTFEFLANSSPHSDVKPMNTEYNIDGVNIWRSLSLGVSCRDEVMLHLHLARLCSNKKEKSSKEDEEEEEDDNMTRSVSKRRQEKRGVAKRRRRDIFRKIGDQDDIIGDQESSLVKKNVKQISISTEEEDHEGTEEVDEEIEDTNNKVDNIKENNNNTIVGIEFDKVGEDIEVLNREFINKVINKTSRIESVRNIGEGTEEIDEDIGDRVKISDTDKTIKEVIGNISDYIKGFTDVTDVEGPQLSNDESNRSKEIDDGTEEIDEEEKDEIMKGRKDEIRKEEEMQAVTKDEENGSRKQEGTKGGDDGEEDETLTEEVDEEEWGEGDGEKEEEGERGGESIAGFDPLEDLFVYRWKNWKLILGQTEPQKWTSHNNYRNISQTPKPKPNKKNAYLFELISDTSERTNVADRFPFIVDFLSQKVKKYIRDVVRIEQKKTSSKGKRGKVWKPWVKIKNLNRTKT